jgi:hypothetical protein
MSQRCAAKLCPSRFYVLATFMVLLSFGRLAVGQVNPGTPAFSAYDSHAVDTINLQNLNISVKQHHRERLQLERDYCNFV